MMIIIEDFEMQPRGSCLFNTWHVRQPIQTPFGDFVVEAQMSLADTSPPDAEMILQANVLADFVRNHSDAVLEKIHQHYKLLSRQPDWMAIWEIPVGLSALQLAPYLDGCSIVVDRDHSEPTIYISPKWDPEHGIYLAVRDNKVEFQND